MTKTIVKVAELPKCSFCEKKARYDFRAYNGQWGYGCEEHWAEYRMYPNLGTGIGQRLMLKTELGDA